MPSIAFADTALRLGLQATRNQLGEATWTGSNPLQQMWLQKTVQFQKSPYVEAIASEQTVALELFLTRHGSNPRPDLAPFSVCEFGIAGSVAVDIVWPKQSNLTWRASSSRTEEQVLEMRDAVRIHRTVGGMPVIEVLNQQPSVHIIPSSPEDNWPARIYGYDGRHSRLSLWNGALPTLVSTPHIQRAVLVTLNAREDIVDLNWLRGMFAVDDIGRPCCVITSAFMQTTFGFDDVHLWQRTYFILTVSKLSSTLTFEIPTLTRDTSKSQLAEANFAGVVVEDGEEASLYIGKRYYPRFLLHE